MHEAPSTVRGTCRLIELRRGQDATILDVKLELGVFIFYFKSVGELLKNV